MKSDAERIQDAMERYTTALHGMQAGVKFEMGHYETQGQSDPSTTPKHLRVGVNASKVEHAALVEILIEKGILSNVEYHEAMAAAMEREHSRYEDHLSQLLGKKVKLI